MEPRPLYLQGRGRGRGRGSGGRGYSQSDGQPGGGGRTPFIGRGFHRGRGGPFHRQPSSPTGGSAPKLREEPEGDDSVAAQDRFEDAAAQHQQAVQRHLGKTHRSQSEEYESSSEEEDLNDDGILDTLLKSYRGGAGGEASELGKTQEYLMNSVKTKANVCLICIETIKRNDPIWCCRGCYAQFHISCIQKWIKDGIYQQTAFSEDHTKKDIPWNCPKCRYEYKSYESPTRYFCFCGKEEDPKFDPWLIPHSCGQTCGRKLLPECGHSCLLLCHPGPCPPCPQTVRVTCHCEKQPPQTRRCGAKEWTCGQHCSRPLSCGHHDCKTPCHPGECPPCPEVSLQPCLCGAEQRERPCASPEWHCKKVCGHHLSCGNHTCEQVCHAGICGECPRAGKRCCPCGKTEFELPCTEDVPTCMETCGKLLQCKDHQCAQRCHQGPCGTCRQMTTKTCRCGQKQKQVQCYKEYTCETKCTKMKDCRKHPCRRKCCDGNCPPCELQCGKSLSCRNHKCSSRCHTGPCYPCPLTTTISCNCKSTNITVPCGRERVTKPPRCSAPCKNPPDCHHPSRLPHRCHFGYCPPCRQICGTCLPGCEHTCPNTCHTAILARVQEKVRRAGPWEPVPESRIEKVDRPCPACVVPVPVACFGGHEICNMPCATARVGCCRRPCGRHLPCTNHTCQQECHIVEGAPDDKMAGTNCQKCEEPCGKPRPDGCVHECLQPCHPGECSACQQMIRMRCHCQLVVQHIECDTWVQAGPKEQQKLKACPSRCPKMMSCGHQCTLTCHPGACPSANKCTERVKQKCPCKRRKKDFLCCEVQDGYGRVECDEVCLKHKEELKKKMEEAEQAKRAEEIKQQQKDLEEFKRIKEGRKRKPRKRHVEEAPPSFLQKHKKLLIVSCLVLLLAVLTFYLFQS